MSKYFSQTISRARYFLATLLLVGLQLAPLGNFLTKTATAATTNTNNPPLTQACGLDIALVLDNSQSINTTQRTQMKNAMTAFTNALNGTPTWFSVTRFGNSSNLDRTFTSNISSVNTAINNLPSSPTGEYTNWQSGINTAQNSFTGGRAGVPNVMIFATDGDPTASTAGSNGPVDESGYALHLPPAIQAANNAKSSGTRMIALGIGGNSNPSVSRLQAISGPNVNTGMQTSDVITTSFAELANDLASFAEATCGGKITIEKSIDHDGNIQTTNDQTPGSNWGFNVSGGNINKNSSTDSDGFTSAIEVGAGTYNVSEIQKEGFAIINAACRNSQGELLGQFNINSQSVNGVSVTNSSIVSCKFYNRPTAGKLTVNKIVNGGPSNGRPQDFSFSINDNGTNQFNQNGTNTLSLPENTQFEVEEKNIPANYKATYSGDCSGKIIATQTKICTITNTYTSQPELIVTKYATNDNGGNILAKDFSLFVNDNKLKNPIETINNKPLSKASYKQVLDYDKSYTVKETIVEGYANTQTTCYNVTNGRENAPEISIPFTAKGDNKYLCEIFNDDIAPKITVTKNVKNVWGGTLTSDDFSLFVNGQYVKSGEGNYFDAGYAIVGEKQEEGYKFLSFSGDCGHNGKLMLKLGGIYNCTITNIDKPGKLIVKKIVINDNGGYKKASDFSFSVNKGKYQEFNKYGVNELYVPNGTYTVKEKHAEGYKTTYKNCHDVKVPNGVTMTCLIINDDIAPKVIVEKDANSSNPLDKDQFFNFQMDRNGQKYNEFSLKDGQKYETDKNFKTGYVKVNEVVPSDWYQASANCKVFGSWEKVEGTIFKAEIGKTYYCKFVNNKYSSISGYKFNDLNSDAEWDKASEEGLANWEIRLLKQECETSYTSQLFKKTKTRPAIDKPDQECSYEAVTSTLTDENGFYEFGELMPGKYKVCETQQSDWNQTYPTSEDGCHLMKIEPGDINQDNNFGNNKPKEPESEGEVLGAASVTTPKQLADTGSSIAIILTVALALIATGLSTLRQKQ